MLLFFVMCYDKIFDTIGDIMRKKPGVNEWVEYRYSYIRSRPVTDFTRKAVCRLEAMNLLRKNKRSRG